MKLEAGGKSNRHFHDYSDAAYAYDATQNERTDRMTRLFCLLVLLFSLSGRQWGKNSDLCRSSFAAETAAPELGVLAAIHWVKAVGSICMGMSAMIR
jgi:hypothetical protein